MYVDDFLDNYFTFELTSETDDFIVTCIIDNCSPDNASMSTELIFPRSTKPLKWCLPSLMTSSMSSWQKFNSNILMSPCYFWYIVDFLFFK